MTDEEMKRLEEACTGVAGGWLENGSSAPFVRFLNTCTPAAVLALIERVRKAEDALDTMRVDLEAARGAAEKNSAAYFAAEERARKAEARVAALEKTRDRQDECERELAQWKQALRGP